MVAAVLLTVVMMGYVVVRPINGPRWVAYAKAPDGTEFRVVQTVIG